MKRQIYPAMAGMAIVFSILLLSPLLNSVNAQESGTVKGIVTDAETKGPLPGAQILLVGTQRGALTDLNGEYIIKDIPPGKYTLKARFVGYAQETEFVEVVAGKTLTVNFSLSVTAVQIDEVVVTGTAMAAERRTIGNTISTVNTRELGQVPTASLSEILQGRAAGVVALPSSGQAGSGASIRIRGMTSVSMSNEPLVYIDGVRVDNYNGETFYTTGGQRPSRLNDISPSDIERVEIIKGASASTLYGTEASNGVIQIFTKSGVSGIPRIHFQHQRGWVRLPKFELGQLTVTQSLLDSLQRKGLNLADYPNLSVGADAPNSLIRTGPLEAYEASIGGGGDFVKYYVSGRYENEIGSLPSNQFRRWNLRGNLSADVTDNLKISVSTGYVNDYLRRPNNDNNIFGLMGNAFLANLYNARPDRPWGEAFTALDVAQKLESLQSVDRFTGGVTINYRPFGPWTHKLTTGIDVVAEENTQYFPYQAGFPLYPDGQKTNNRRTNTRLTLDYATTFTTELTKELSSRFTGGVQGFFDSDYEATAQGTKFPAPGVSTVSAAANTDGFESRMKVVNAGFFGQEQLGLWERLFVTAGFRADGNSAFGKDVTLAIYPKVSGSYIISEESFWPFKFWNSMKLRAAWGASGKQPGAFDALRTWSPIAALEGTPGVTTGNLGQPNLKPEKSQEIELGFDAGFLDSRYGIEFTYYSQVTRDALLLRRYPPSQGFLNLQLDNVGEVKNKGFEVALRAIPIRTPDFEAMFTVNVARNDNKVTSLGGTAPLPFGLGIGKVKEGYPISSLWAQVVDSVRYSDNTTGPDKGFGTAILSKDEQYLGQTMPVWTGSFSVNLTLLHDIRIYALADWETGHVIYNGTQYFMSLSSYNVYQPMRDLRQKLSDPNLPVDERHRLQDEFQRKNPAATRANFVEKADFLKIREVAITYTIPQEWLRSFGISSTISLTFAARNLATFTGYTGEDPEVNYAGQQDLSRGQDFLTVPQARRFILTLNVGL